MYIVIIYVTIFIGEGLLAQIILLMNSNQLAKAFAVIMFLMRLLQIVTDRCVQFSSDDFIQMRIERKGYWC